MPAMPKTFDTPLRGSAVLLTDICVKDVSFAFEDIAYRTPIKFGGVALSKVTLLNVTMTVETVAGKVATGFGSMPLGNVWAWPSKVLKYRSSLKAMWKAFASTDMTSNPIWVTEYFDRTWLLATQMNMTQKQTSL